MKRALFIVSFLFLGTALVVMSCSTSTPSTTPSPSAQKFLYVATGVNYAGQLVVTPTPSKVVTKFTLDGQKVAKIRDYNDGSGDTPVGIVNYDDNNILVLIENAAGRRIAKVSKDGSGNETNFFINASALNSTLRAFTASPNGGVLLSKSSAVEAVNSSRARITLAGNPFISAPAGSCATATTLITSMTYGPLNSIFITHASAANNQIDIISTTGYASAADCLGELNAPDANHYPTASLYHSSGKFLVSYGNDSTSPPTHDIYSYDVTNTALTNPSKIFYDLTVLQGITSMVEMPDATILVSSSTFGTVERFTYGAGKLIRSSTSFLSPSAETTGISSMFIAN